MTPLERLAATKAKADSSQADRRGYMRFIRDMRENGWTDEEVDEYAATVKVIMGSDDQAAMDLYPAGVFSNATEVREAAKTFWRERLSA
jgi:hypothetical protein